jgi:hypothetical protein
VKSIFLVLGACLLAAPLTASAHAYLIPSPTHEQTFAYGSERHQQWMTSGSDRHLALATEFTNDPYVDRIEPRQYDDFTFDFPSVRLGADGRTFFYHAPNGRSVPVAERSAGFLGLEEVRLLDTSSLVVAKPHGYLSLLLIVTDRHPTSTASL